MPGLFTGASGLFGGFSGLLYGGSSLSTPPGLLADAVYGGGTPAGVLLGQEPSGMAMDFTSSPPSLLVRTLMSLQSNYYSGLPFQNEGNGPITFSRTSNATVTDSDGKIKWAGHNLLLNSETFDASGWAKTSATVTANSIAAPDGTTTADTIAATGANGTVLQTWTAAGFQMTFAVWLRRKTGTGTIEIAADNGTYTAVTITSDWALYTVTQTPASGSRSAGIRIVSSGDEVYAWGAHLYRSDLGGMVLNPARGDSYYPTTPRNLLRYTEDFSNNAAWALSGILAFGSGSIANTTETVDPLGGHNADKIVENTALSSKLISQNIGTVISGSSVTYSVHAKYAGRVLQLAFGFSDVTNNPRANFDLQNGVLGSVSPEVTASISSLGNGWYRCSVVATTAVASGFDVLISLASSTTSTRIASYTGDGVSGVYIWGAQLSDSASLDAYSPVYGAAVTFAAYYAPRLDYDANGSALGLLVEEQRTNTVLNSNSFVTGWSNINTTATASSGVSPDGTNNAVKIEATTTATATSAQIVSSAGSASGNTYSIYVKQGSGATIANRFAIYNSTTAANVLAISINYSTGAITYTTGSTGASATNVGNGWWRVTLSATTGISAGNTLIVYAGFVGAPVTAGDFFYAYGAQLEAGSFATSYIPTGASTATRTADVASVSTQAFPYSATEGTVVANVTLSVAPSTQTLVLYTLSDGTANERIMAQTGSGSGGNINTLVTDGGVTQAQTVNGSLSAAGSYRYANAYKVNDFASVANGGTAATDTLGTLPTMDRLNIGASNFGTGQINGHIRQITYLPRRISNSELQARTV